VSRQSARQVAADHDAQAVKGVQQAKRLGCHAEARLEDEGRRRNVTE